MSLNISTILSSLKGFYDPNKRTGERYTGGTNGLNDILSKSGLNGTTEKTLTADNLSTNIFENGLKITVSSESANKFSYKIDSENGKIIIFGNNLKIQVDEDNVGMIEVVGISNVINATSKADNINLIGYDNEINAGEGKDEVTVYGDDNEVTTYGNDNKNIFSGISGNTLIVNDKKFEIKVNDLNKDKAEITVNKNDAGRLFIDAQNAKIFVQESDETAYNDNISLKGNNNYLDTGDGNDDISVEGNNNIIVTGDDDLRDTVEINGKNNEVSGDENDIVTYTANSGTIVLTNSDNSQHYIKVGDFEYFVQRNTDFNRDVTISYELTSTGVFKFKGDNFSLKAVKDGAKDNIKVIGNNNYIDTGDEADTVTIEGNSNQIHAGEGDDNVSIIGEDNEAYGDAGKDSVAIDGKNNTVEDFEEKHYVVILNAENPGKTVEIGGKDYLFELTKSALKDIEAEKLTQIVVKYVENEDGLIEITADNIILTAYSGRGKKEDRADKIKFIGSNSKINAGDGDDEVTVIGDNNVVDGWSGNDTISVAGWNNKALGFLGDDEINIVQRELTEAELNAEIAKIEDKDENGNERTEEQKIEMVNKDKANTVDGEFDTDTVTTLSKYTQISKETEIYKSLTQSIKLDPKDDEKKIVITDDDGNEYSYTIKNYATEENNNPFVSTRTISYDIIEGQLVVKGDYISVVADSGQNDNVKVIGSNNFLDMGDGDDTIYANENCNYNLIFGGIGKDSIIVNGNNNTVYGDNKYEMKSEDDSDKIAVEGTNNVVTGGKGDDVIKLTGDNFRAFGNEGNDKFIVNAINSEIHGGNAMGKDGEDYIAINNNSSNKYYDFANKEMTENKDKIELTSKNKTAKIEYKNANGQTIVFKVEPNILAPEKLAGKIIVDYEVVDGQLIITGDNISVNLTNGSDKSVNVKLIGDDCRLETFGGNDNIEVVGNKNKILGGNGKNKIKVTGNKNEIDGGKDVDWVYVEGDNNNIIRNGALDYITVVGKNNQSRYLASDDKIEVSTEVKLADSILTNTNGTQVVVIKNRAYELSLFGLEGDELTNANINVEFHYHKDGYIRICGTGGGVLKNVKIRVIDDKNTQTEDEKAADNQDSILFIADNCYISGGNGDDIIKVKGNNNIVDGWSGNDSIEVVEGNNNEIRGFDGNDTITITKGNDNKINGEQGIDSLEIIEGNNNTYTNIEKLNKNKSNS